MFSTFSSDSGNVHDFTEGSEHRMHMPKSKSMPDYNDAYSQVPGESTICLVYTVVDLFNSHQHYVRGIDNMEVESGCLLAFCNLQYTCNTRN